MRAYERFLNYVKVSTASDRTNEDERPSSGRQFDLARMLVDEMKELGIADARVDDKCYVYGSLPATSGHEKAPALGLIAHMDTCPDFSGENVKPIFHEKYDGEDIALPTGRVIPVKIFPDLRKLKGRTLITASGDTLLGADDKAGIAEILTACERLINEKIPHGKICIGFTPDEEIGHGADEFDVAAFGARYAYTVDGGAVGEIEDETFNAAAAKLAFSGVSVHTGSAKGIMVNASTLAAEFMSLIPQDECPEKTEGYEGFYHLGGMEGCVETARLEYIIRDHDKEKFEARKNVVKAAAETIRKRHGDGCIELELTDQYYNMREIIEKEYHLVENARTATIKAGLEPLMSPVRGGTDGSRLSFMGLPCPNLGTGGHYFHGPNECIAVEDMDKAVEIILNIVDIYSQAE